MATSFNTKNGNNRLHADRRLNIHFPLGLWAGVGVCDGFVDPEICGKVDDLLTKHWHTLWEANVLSEGKSMLGVNTSIKNSSDMELSINMGDDLYNLGWFEEELQEGISKALNYYVSKYDGLANYAWPLCDTGFQVQRYEEGHGFYTEHIDGGPFGKTKDRFLAVLLYLNDVEIGGETNFTKHNLSVEPRAGRVLIFPVHWLYPHKGEIPLSGHKTIITTFIEQQEDGTY